MTLSNLTITIPPDATEPLRFAAAELQQYLTRIAATAVRVQTAELPTNTLVVGSTAVPPLRRAVDGPDAFAIEPTATGAVVHGESGRAVLHGVYALLEQLGCCWSLHGREEEVLPRLAHLPAIQPAHSAPRFTVRGYSADIMTWHYGDVVQLAEHLAADHEFLDWMGKSGANAYLLIRHPFDSQLTIPELLPDFARRGIDVEYGGHVIPLLLPREEFAQHPDYFPQSTAGVRSEFGNLCTANAAAVRLATANAIRYVHDYPELSVLHIWGADLWGGGWCHCPECAAITVQDQSVRLCNAVAEGLMAAGAARPVCYLAYHDTIEADLHERPAANVVVEFAPRERCYGHALNDPGCPTNQRYRVALERYTDLFAGRVRVFEYYADAILFCGCAVPLGEVIAADVEYYHRLGIREITNLQFGSFSLWAYPVNFLAYAAATRGGGCDVARATAAYGGRFGVHAATLSATLGALEAMMREVVTYGDIRRPPKGAEAIRALRPRIERAIEQLAALADRLAPAAADESVAAWRALVRYNGAVLTGVRQQLAGANAAGEYEAALDIMRAVDRRFTGLWGAVTLPVIHAYHSAGGPGS